MRIGSDYVTLFECPNSGTEPPGYCCGPDPTSCCANKSYISVPAGTLTLRLFQLAAIIPTSSVSSVSLTTAPTTPTSTAPPSQSSTGTHTLALALGLGLSLGIGLLAVLFFVGLQLQKYNKLHAGGQAVGDSVGSRPNRRGNLA